MTPQAAPASVDIDTRVEELLAALTLDEKLSLCAGANFWQTKAIPRLGIPALKVSDGPRGVAWHSARGKHTAYPSGIALGASWDRELAETFGQLLGEETRAAGCQVILGPAVNICRTPLNGRTFEYFTEDPYLNRSLAVPMIRGIQSQGVAACIKHYAANNQETHRMKTSAEVSERALREIYLPVFEAAVREADVWSVMAAYNAINGVAGCEHYDLLTTKLRQEWGFSGFVVSDWFAARRTTSSEACIKAGLNLEMPGKGSRYKTKNLRRAYDQGLFTEAELNNALSGLLRVMGLTGLFEEQAKETLDPTPQRQLSRRMAAESMVLLKNENTLLPLDSARSRRLAIIGPKAKKRNCLPLWGGSSGVWPPYEITPFNGLRERMGEEFTLVKNPSQADAVILFVGLSHKPGLDSEVMDRKSLQLPEKQRKLIERTVKQNANTIVVLINGSPITMEWADDVPAIVEARYPGMEGGRAIADVLFGDTNPSGKLPVTFPASLEDCPAHKTERQFPGDGQKVHYDEGIFVGYRYFDEHDIAPLYPFGHGLSYTQFDYSDLELSPSLNPAQPLQGSFILSNTGKYAGAEVAQIYVSDPGCSQPRPPKELKDFAKVYLEPGQSRRVSFELSIADLAWYSEEKGQWQLEDGTMELSIGSSSRDLRLNGHFTHTNSEHV